MTHTANTILSEDVHIGGRVGVHVDKLRQGDIDTGTGKATVGGFDQPAVEFKVDFPAETIHVWNHGEFPWSAGAALVITWEGLPIESTVTDHETRIAALESGGTGGVVSDPALEARVATLESAVDTHEYQLIGHETRISQNYTKINALEERVAALEAAP